MKKIIRGNVGGKDSIKEYPTNKETTIKEELDVKKRFDNIEREYKDVLEVLKNA